jgi:transcriptional regulator with XRE-family HTH domain
METIGQRLRRLRRARHPLMTQAELAKLCKITPQAISNLERGIAESTTYLVALAAALDVSPHYLEHGDAVAETEDPADAPVEAATMLAMAKELAGDDDTLLGLIEDAEAEGARGRIGGAVRHLSRLPGGMTDVWEVPFYGNSYAELAVIGDGDSNLDVLVTDENGNTVCFDVSWSDKVSCDFVPAWNGYFYITVQNTGSKRNSYYLLTN